MTEIQKCDSIKVNLLRYPSENDWLLVKQTALSTIWKKSNSPPSADWRMKILASEHSPIRQLSYTWEWVNLPYWVSVHLVRHKFGIEHFVSSQRNDKQDMYDRNKAPQDSPVTHRATANAQTIMNISKKRLCNCASLETIKAWELFLESIKDVSPELYKLCVPNCIYRGGICTEFYSCGFNKTELFKTKLQNYIEMIEV